MEFSAKDVARLREMTGAGMMDCKKALTSSAGDMDKAVEYLRERGMSMAAKKSSRVASEGAVSAFVTADGKKGAVIELNCESDFVSKGPDFQGLAKTIAEHTASSNASDVDTILNEKTKDGKTVSELITNAIAVMGEKVSLRRFDRYIVKSEGKIESYIHMGGKIGVLLNIITEKNISSNEKFKDMCHDIALHIAALSPSYIDSSEISPETIAQETEINKAQIVNDPKNANKPQAVLDKMIEGRIKKYFFKENCLLEQDFVKDPSMTVESFVAGIAKEVGSKITINSFKRLVMGEGLEKRVDNFAEEIAKMQTNN